MSEEFSPISPMCFLCLNVFWLMFCDMTVLSTVIDSCLRLLVIKMQNLALLDLLVMAYTKLPKFRYSLVLLLELLGELFIGYPPNCLLLGDRVLPKRVFHFSPICSFLFC